MKTLISHLNSSMPLFYDYKLAEITKLMEENLAQNPSLDK